MNLKTFTAKPNMVKQKWLVVDASQYVLGRMASQIASLLRGKHKPEYTPHVDTGDYVIVINAASVKVTGKKVTDKMYYSHSGYPGGIKEANYAKVMSENPERIIASAVKGMLPKNKLGAQMYQKLKIYAGSEHPHTAQQPELIEL